MIEFAIARYGEADYRLLKWDGSTDTEIGSGWGHEPTLRECNNALLDYHASGNQPFSSRDGTLDCLDIANQWPLSYRDMTIDDETLPWDDQQ